MPSLRWAPHRAASDPCPKKHEEARRGLWAPLCARGLEVLLSAKSSRAPSFLGILLFLRRNNTFPVFATYLIPAASPPPLRGGAKSASNPFAGARKPHTCGFSLFIWPCLGPRRSRRCQLILGVPLRAAPKAPMLPAAPPCALPPPSYLFSGAHRSPVSILFLSGLLAGCSPGVHPCGN